ncbi:MAG: hypothetical protein LBQ80_02555 [Clostridium sp.]|nr:hypothetical protein [Clostridium sp.]
MFNNCGYYGCGGCGGCGRQQAQTATVSFRCTDCAGNPLPGCVCTLCGCGKFYTASSDECGCCSFDGVCPGNYVLGMASAPAGYRTNCCRYNCKVCGNGCSTIGGVNSSCFTLRCAQLPQGCGCNGGGCGGCGGCAGYGQYGCGCSG